MRKMLYLLLAVTMVFSATAVFSQTVTVRGTVISSSNNDGVPNATVTVKGTNRATQTDARGNFSIQAAKGDILVLSSVGFKPMEFKVSDNATPRITLSSTEEMLGEVVVTALDIKRNPRELGYSVQKVNGEELKETQRENFVNGLQGRVSGLSVLPTSGQAGASSAVVLRGFNSLSQSNQPLFVIDGIIMDNSTIDENSNGGQGIGLARELPAAGNQNPGNRNSDYSNRMTDLNPNDIETITVLKGPEATALYGSQASSGAIIITTRKAKSNQFALQYDNSFRVQKATRFPETFDVYQNGTNGVNTDVFLYFGEPYPADARKFDNIDIFFRTGFAQTHNLGMDFGVKNSVFRVSGSYFDQKGVVPENDFKRINFRISNTTKIGDKIDIIPSLAYVNSVNDKVLRSAGGYMNSLLIWPRTNSILYYEDQDGDKVPLFNSNPNAEYDNPFFSVYKNKSRDVTDRYMATLGLNFRPFEWLSLAGRFGYDTYKTDGYTVYHPQSFFIPQSFNGAQDNYFLKYKGYNHTITATAKKKVGDFNFRLMAGTMWQDYETSMFSVSGNNLTDPLRTDTSNTAPATRVKLLRNYNGEYNQQILRQIAYFGEFAVNYKNMVFLSYTHRFESASTLPEQNRNYN
jgi:TonB-linked SusC/RagA family outer membrane protein